MEKFLLGHLRLHLLKYEQQLYRWVIKRIKLKTEPPLPPPPFIQLVQTVGKLKVDPWTAPGDGNKTKLSSSSTPLPGVYSSGPSIRTNTSLDMHNYCYYYYYWTLVFACESTIPLLTARVAPLLLLFLPLLWVCQGKQSV